MEVNIKITLTDGTSYKLKPKEKLGKINPSKKAIFMFNNLEFYEGYTSGDILDDGETEYFTIRKAPSEKGGIDDVRSCVSGPEKRTCGMSSEDPGNASDVVSSVFFQKAGTDHDQNDGAADDGDSGKDAGGGRFIEDENADGDGGEGAGLHDVGAA